MDKKDYEEIKNDYEKLKKKYNLPEFYDLNRIFDIDSEHLEINDKEFLLRKLRKIIADRIVDFSRFLENIVQPNNPPLFFIKLLKKIETKDKESIDELYGKIGNIELNLILLDLNYDETKEALFIKEAYLLFNGELKQKITEIMKILIQDDKSVKKEYSKSYLG
jgi:hypothetical protein